MTREEVVDRLDAICDEAPEAGYRLMEWRKPGAGYAMVTSFAWQEMSRHDKLEFIRELNEMGIENS